MAGVYLAVMVSSIIWSIYYSGKFSDEYFGAPVLIGPLILQGACLMVAVLNWPNPDIEVWFVVGVVATFASYAYGLTACWKRAKGLTEGNTTDAALAVLTQALLPTGVVLLIVFLFVMAAGNGNKKSTGRKSKR